MENEMENPAALAGANRVSETNVSTQGVSTSPEPNFQAVYVAKRFRISPCLARVICELAHIGGRLL